MKWVIQLIGTAVRLIVQDFYTLLVFEIGYKYMLVLFTPLVQDIFSLAMKQAGIAFFTNQTAFQLLKNPVSVLLLFLLLLFSAWAVLTELSAIMIYFDWGWNRSRLSVRMLFKKAAVRAASLIRPGNAPLLVFLFLLMPAAGFPFTSGPLRSLRIPDFITGFIFERPLLLLLFAVILILLYTLLIRKLLSVYGRLLYGQPSQGVPGKWDRKKRFSSLCCIVLWLLLILLFAGLVCFLAVFLTLLSIRAWIPAESRLHWFWILFNRLYTAGRLFGPIYFFVCQLSLIAAFYYCLRHKDPAPVFKRQDKPRPGFRLILKRSAVLLVLTAVYTQLRPSAWYQPEDSFQTQVIAHRGGSFFAPENTLLALSEALKSGSHYAEIDVRLTKDGIPVLSHDENLKRTAGINRNLSSLTCEEVKKLTVSGERIPTLEEALAASHGKIKLMIELKGQGSRLEEAVLPLIRRYRFEDSCILASMDYRSLERMKAGHSNIRTCYLASIMYGGLGSLEAADILGVEQTFLSQALISQAHSLGKPVFAWTVNSEKAVRRVLRMNADGIITDNPYLADFVIHSAGGGIAFDINAVLNTEGSKL